MNLKHLAYFLFLINYQYRYESTCTHDYDPQPPAVYSKNIPSSKVIKNLSHRNLKLVIIMTISHFEKLEFFENFNLSQRAITLLDIDSLEISWI